MASNLNRAGEWNRNPIRYLMWGTAAFLLALPGVAMQVTREVQWGPMDFAIMAALLGAACGTVELAARSSASWAFRIATGIAVAASFLLIWINLAVGIIGPDDGNPANLMFAGVVAVAGGGALLAWGRTGALAKAMFTAAVAQTAVAAIALAGNMGAGEQVWPWGFAILMAAFTLMWFMSGWLFRTAARTA